MEKPKEEIYDPFSKFDDTNNILKNKILEKKEESKPKPQEEVYNPFSKLDDNNTNLNKKVINPPVISPEKTKETPIIS